MKPVTKKILAALAVAAVLALAFWYGGSAPNLRGWTASVPPAPSPSLTASVSPAPVLPSPSPSAAPTPTPTPSAAACAVSAPVPTPLAAAAPTPAPTPSPALTAAPITAPTPSPHPMPVDPQDLAVTDAAQTCTLSVRCDTLLTNLDALDSEKAELVPEDGVIFPATEVTFYAGESVFDVLLRVMKENAIHLEFETTPLYQSAYIEGIHNLYEFDCGELSGWMYRVNGWFPNYGCSRYALQPGDSVEWVYTCDLGVDVGGGEAGGGQT